MAVTPLRKSISRKPFEKLFEDAKKHDMEFGKNRVLLNKYEIEKR
jgi:hypothetical protein